MLRAAIFYLLFYGWTVVLSPFYVPLMLLPRRQFRTATRFWVRGAVLAMRAGLGITHEIRGRENLPPEPFLIASKHQSMWETQILNLVFYNCIFILKRSLLSVPLVGWFVRCAGMIDVDRSAGAAAMRRMLRMAKERVAEGHSIVIFPEGTRTKVGDAPPYQPGIIALYRTLELPVVPVALNSGFFWPRREFVKKSGCIVMEILPPISPGLSRQEFMDKLKNRIQSATDRLEAEAKAKAKK